MKAASPFRPSLSVKPRETDPQSAFASRHFAARRAGFLLRELARQQQEAEAAPEIEEIQEAVIEPAEDFAATLEAERQAEEARHAQAVQEAYQRGRAEAFAEVAQGLDQAILALDAAAQALAEREARLERDLVVPLAKAGVDIAAQLARQKLATPEGLAQYLDAVQAALNDQGDDVVTVTAHLHPDDLTLLDRANIKPQHLRLLPDPLVSAGGVMLSATDQVIDDRFESRMREVREAALGTAADVLRLAPPVETPAMAAAPVTPAAAVITEVVDAVVDAAPIDDIAPMVDDVPDVPDMALADDVPDLSLDDDVPDLALDDDIPDLSDDLSDDSSPSDFIE